ncbi:MAG: glycosyltransferase family 4 protein [Leptolyngbyaceae cyanobacterium]
MKVLHISTEDTRPGASRAAYRLSHGLQRIGIDSSMLVQNKRSDDAMVHTVLKGGMGRILMESRKLLDKTRLTRYPQRLSTPFSAQWIPNTRSLEYIQHLNPDILSLHWVGDGFLQVESLPKLQRPFVWTLRDMWPFTGGCHYDQNCGKYTASCGTCPQLGSQKSNDLSRAILNRKKKSWQSIDLTIVALSRWIGQCAASSAVFKDRRIEVIPNGLDTELYRPIDPGVARKVLRLPKDKHLVVFGAVGATSDPRKGFHLLQAALQELSASEWRDKLELVVFGASKANTTDDFGFKTHFLGKLNDDLSLVLAYSAADVLVAPSMQENLANTVLESIACGTPSVAFKIGGMPDLIAHEQNGYLVQPFEATDLAKGIVWVLENRDRYQKLAANARKKVEQEFTLDIQANRYKSLFEEILQTSKHAST